MKLTTLFLSSHVALHPPAQVDPWISYKTTYMTIFSRDFEGTFAKDCGDDEICMSDLHMTGSLDLDRDATGKHYLLKLGENDIVPLLVEVKNSMEPAYESTLIVNHNEALIFDALESEVSISFSNFNACTELSEASF